MKNSANLLLQDDPQFRIAGSGQVRLASFWDGILLADHFWRLYCHDSPGAGVILNGRKTELLPGFLYLLPPHCNLVTWCSGSPVQLYFHFETNLFSGSAEYSCNQLVITPDLEQLLAKLRKSITGRFSKGSNLLVLQSMALTSAALARLPKEALTELHPDLRISGICDYLRNHLKDDLDLDFLMNRAKMSKRSFLRRFSAFTGSTPYQYLLHLRYMHAARLLKSGELPIEEICDMVGIHDRFHFSRMFRKMFGAPPVQYRIQHQNIEEKR